MSADRADPLGALPPVVAAAISRYGRAMQDLGFALGRDPQYQTDDLEGRWKRIRALEQGVADAFKAAIGGPTR